HRAERGFGLPLTGHETEVPVLDVRAVPARTVGAQEHDVPLVGPGEDENAGAAGAEGRSDLQVERVRLRIRAVAARVQADLREHERTVTRQVVQAGEIGLEALPLLQVHVEAEEVDERELEV